MDLGEKDKFGLEKRGGDGHLSYNSSGISSDWQFGHPPMTLGLISAANASMPDCQGNQMDSSPCPSASMVDSFCPNLWGQPPSSQNLGGFSESNVGRPSRLDMVWNPQAPMLKNGGMFSQNAAGILPPGLAQFPADSAFIERAARFSCFGGGGGGSYGNMMSPLSIGEPLSPFSNSSKAVVSGALSQQTDASIGEFSKDIARRGADQGSNGGSPMNSQNGASASDLGDAELSGGGGGGQEVNHSSQGMAAKKRKKNTQMDIDRDKEETSEPVDAANEKNEVKQKAGQSNSNLGSNGKNTKDGTDPPKEDYIHVRARRGQATNSHSLAERVRREKISERMKFLQDLVPGCNKVTGKAVMLDEIINYVQSLQRQVEFLSMKLAAVNPQLEFNVEGLLSKEVLSSRSGPSSTIGFSPEMAHPLLHPTQQALIQSGLSNMGTPSSDVLRRAVNTQFTAMNTYKEAKRQMPTAWDDEFSNVISQMGFSTSAPLNIQDLSGKARDGFPL